MQELSLSEYVTIDRRKSGRRIKKKAKKAVKIALLGSFALNGFREVLNAKCQGLGIQASFYVNDYNQYVNELIDKRSKFYKFHPDITLLFTDVAALFGDVYLDPYRYSEKKRMDAALHNYSKLARLAKNFVKWGSGILVMNNLVVPTYSPLGISEAKERFGLFD
ncbi:MAG: hypothetical protein NG740_05550, partial [Omnitrophica bacterium]|nr:hypothetical protein [Candidatus Omnitrophota bacterium]